MAEEAKLHPDQVTEVAQQVVMLLRPDLVKLMEMSAQSPPPTPPLMPPVKYEGLNPMQRDQLKRELLIDAKDYVNDKIEEFLPRDEIEQRIRRGSEDVSKHIDTLGVDLKQQLRDIVKEEVTKLRTELFKIFDDLEMPIDEGKPRLDTRDKLKMLWAIERSSKEWKSEMLKALRTSFIAGVVGLIGAFCTYVYTRGGPPR